MKVRTVRQQLWHARLNCRRGRQVRQQHCLIARKIDAPEDAKPNEWRLLTNREARTPAAVVELIDLYRARWEIETQFNVLKNACRVEALQLGTIAQLERALAMSMGVAGILRT